MRISRVRIENYRNLKSVDVELDNLVALVGENNSGKSNFLKALSLPFMSDDGASSKRLTWLDINNEAKERYYSFIQEHREEIAKGNVDAELFFSFIPAVSVTVDFQWNPIDAFDVHDLLVADGEDFIPRIQYRWFAPNPKNLLDLVSSLVQDVTDVRQIKMSLLPMGEFRHEISSPDADGGRKMSYDVLSRFRHFAIPAERDGFAASNDRLGSRPLIHLLQDKVDPAGQKKVEQGYSLFLQTIRDAAELDKVINWQEYSNDPRARDFFGAISVLPNMPPMGSILGSIRLGYDDESLSLQGLGNRNLILMAVMLNAYLQSTGDLSLRVVAVEEPEAHLCVNNVLLMASLFKSFGEKDTRTQLVYTTHDAEFVNKVGLDKVVVLHGGNATSLKGALTEDDRGYLSKNPNTDIFKLFFSRRLIMVEGFTEELLIKSYLMDKGELNDIKVLSFHKGYKDIIRIWKLINDGNGNRLAVIRDNDNQPNAQREHEEMANSQVYVGTTKEYTLETEIVAAGKNLQLLRDRYGSEYGWTDMTEDDVQKDWRDNRKTDVMLRISHDLASGDLIGFTLPEHIQKALDFLGVTTEDPQTEQEVTS